jgi:hypothetical protein
MRPNSEQVLAPARTGQPEQHLPAVRNRIVHRERIHGSSPFLYAPNHQTVYTGYSNRSNQIAGDGRRRPVKRKPAPGRLGLVAEFVISLELL